MGSNRYPVIRGFGKAECRHWSGSWMGFEWVMYEARNISYTSKGSFRALLVLVVKGNSAIRAVSDTKWCKSGNKTTDYSDLASDLIQISEQAS